MRLRTSPAEPERLDRRGRAYLSVMEAADRIGWPVPVAYNATVCDDPAFVWYRVAKVGTETIHRHLDNHTELRLNHPYRVRLPRRGYGSYFHFAFVRNPWERLVSCWHDKVLKTDHFRLGARRERMRRFPEFVEYVGQFDLDRCDSHIHRQASLIDLARVDFIGRFERFADDFSEVCRRLGLPESFGHENPTQRNHYSAYYDDRTAEIVGRLYERDARLFGYGFTRVGAPKR